MHLEQTHHCTILRGSNGMRMASLDRGRTVWPRKQWRAILALGTNAGVCRPWWSRLYKSGPGNAITPNTPCGHKWPERCNSAHCNAWWCSTFPRLFPWLTYGVTAWISWRCPRQKRQPLAFGITTSAGNVPFTQG